MKKYLYILLAITLMGAAPSRTYTYTSGNTISATEVTANEDAIFNYLREGVDTIKDASIVNDDISASAAIQSDKVSLASVGQTLAMSSSILKFAKGVDVTSATTITLGDDGNFFDITGTTTITSITAKSAGTLVVLQFDGIVTVTDGSNLSLAGNFVTTAGDTITLISDGVLWHEVCRSVN